MNLEGMMESENRHLATVFVILDSGRNHEQMLKLVG